MSEERSERSDGKIVKMEVDYSSTVDQRLPECEKMAKVSRSCKRPAPAESWCTSDLAFKLTCARLYANLTPAIKSP